jgi:riboflavin synthase
MFTGIIRAMGKVERIEARRGDLRLTILCGNLPWRDYAAGDSIAVNGVCLTAVELRPGGFDADVSRETLDVTSLKSLRATSPVNLEPALRVGEPLGGHFVSGHVDCVGTVLDARRDGRSRRLRMELPHGFRRYLAPKGSITVDGVSLTINEVSEDSFGVNIIPHTAETTIIGGYAAGARVNIEVDLIARYLERLMQERGGLSQEFLRAHGYG